MRINKFIALSTGLSRRAADTAIEAERVRVNDRAPEPGQDILASDVVTLDGKPITPAVKQTILFHKPVGYVVSRDGQGSQTIYDILPDNFIALKPVGRLDKDSSGLLLLTNDGELANALTHPSRQKQKIYEVSLNKPLQPLHHQMINDFGIELDDGVSKLGLHKLTDDGISWQITMSEGRNRQIRRTFAALGYHVKKLHRTQFGEFTLGDLKPGKWK